MSLFRQNIREGVESLAGIVHRDGYVFRPAFGAGKDAPELLERVTGLREELLGILRNIPELLAGLPFADKFLNLRECDADTADRGVHGFIAHPFASCAFDGSETRVRLL